MKDPSKKPGPPPRRKVGRPRKHQPGDIVWYLEKGEDEQGNEVEYRQYGVVVDYYRKTGGNPHPGLYRIIRMTSPAQRTRYWGGTVWVQTPKVHAFETSWKASWIRSVFRNNINLGAERGCGCMCCIHTSVPASHVTKDGQFIWEVDDE